MNVFDLFTSNENYWINSDGEIECDMLACGCAATDCHDKCPINQQTLGLECYQDGDLQGAISHFEKAVEIEPKYKEAWANLGTIYGIINMHELAVKAFYVAYSIDNTYANAIRGLITSNKNLGHFDLTLSLCDRYAALYGEEETKSFIDDVKDFINKGTVKKSYTAMEMSNIIVKYARKEGLLGANHGLPHIPEILSEAAITCKKIKNEILDQPQSLECHVFLKWAALAGMGAVWHWDKSWNALKNKGIAETLLEPRGVFAMDEYVIDIIGIGYNTDDGKEFSESISSLCFWAVYYFTNEETDQIKNMVDNMMQAMYNFGMVYQMEKLGMK